MKRWHWALLIFELLLFVVILALPQVDLPDFAFHRGNAPIVARARISSPPILSAVTGPIQTRAEQHCESAKAERLKPTVHSDSHSLLSLFCSYLC